MKCFWSGSKTFTIRVTDFAYVDEIRHFSFIGHLLLEHLFIFKVLVSYDSNFALRNISELQVNQCQSIG